MKLWIYPLAAVLAVSALAGCGSKQAAAPAEDKQPATEAQLYEIWDQLSAQPPETVDLELARGVANNLAQVGPDKLLPLLDRMAEEDASKTSMFLAMVALRPLVNEQHEAKLVEITQPDKPSRARRSAIELLSTLGTDSAKARVKELMDDADPRVATGAMLALLHLEDQPDAVARVREFWDSTDTLDLERQEIVRRIPELAAPSNLDMFITAVGSVDWDPTVRQRAIAILGGSSEERAYQALQQAAERSPEPQLQQQAKVAAEAVKQRMDQGLGDLKFNVLPDGRTETQIPLESKPKTE
ncbi:MAG: hypothetical protein GC168_10140 [Candidatus Hydrogenedens sp.]|nr:hypothetical protein [Candidatus Hydrogenedens sp.]